MARPASPFVNLDPPKPPVQPDLTPVKIPDLPGIPVEKPTPQILTFPLDTQIDRQISGFGQGVPDLRIPFFEIDPAPVLDDDPYNPEVVDARIRIPYKANPAHDPTSPSFDSRKTPEPPDAELVYQSAVRAGMKTWIGIGERGIYQFYYDNFGGVHFSGIVTVDKVPNDVRKELGLEPKGSK